MIWSGNSQRSGAPPASRLVEPPRRQAWILGLLAVALLAACLFFAFYLPQTPGRMERTSAGLIPRLDVWEASADLGLPGLRSPENVALLLVLFSALGFGAYALAIAAAWHHGERRSALAVAWGGGVLAALASVFAMPTTNTDIYNYMVSARVASEYGMNPHYVAPVSFPRDPIYSYASAQYTDIAGDNKLPAWTVFNVTAAALAGDEVVTALLFYRSALLAVHLANAALIVRITRRLARRHQATSLVIYAWNPVVALQTTSKSDTIMVFWLLAAIALLVYYRERLAAVPLALSVLVKLLTLPLAAVYAVRALRLGGVRRVVVEGALAAGAVALLYLPFIRGPELIRAHFELLGTEGSTISGPARLVAIAGAVALVLALGWFRSETVPRLLESWLIVVIYFGFFLTRFSMAWYLIMLVALASLVIDWRYQVVMLALTSSAFLVSTWGATSNSSFTLPSLLSARMAVYYALPVVTLGALAIPWFIARRRHMVRGTVG